MIPTRLPVTTDRKVIQTLDTTDRRMKQTRSLVTYIERGNTDTCYYRDRDR